MPDRANLSIYRRCWRTLTKADGIITTVFFLLVVIPLATPPVKGFWRLVEGRLMEPPKATVAV